LVAIFVLVALVALTGLQMWKEKLPGALTRLPRLGLYLALIAIVLFIRWAIKRLLPAALSKGKRMLREQVADEVVTQGRQRAGDVVSRGVQGAKGVLSNVGQGVEREWHSLVDNRSPSSAPRRTFSRRCRVCGRTLRPGAKFCDGCGTVAGSVCPQCGRAIASGARFCRECGAPLQRQS
jgi:hypothetical protein